MSSEHPFVETNTWRLTKEIPVSTLIFIVMQTMALTWFLAGQNSSLTTVIETVKKSDSVAYTKDEARHEREFTDSKLKNIEQSLADFTRRLALVEGQLTARPVVGATR